LINSYCLPYLTYCFRTLELNKSKLRKLNVCWNDESVKELQYHFSEMPL